MAFVFKLTKNAYKDLHDIGQYTQKEWGREQRVDYLDRLDNAFFKIAENPGMGRSAEHIRTGYRCYSVGKHVIFYQERSDIILVVRILHQNMDLQRHLN